MKKFKKTRFESNAFRNNEGRIMTTHSLSDAMVAAVKPHAFGSEKGSTDRHKINGVITRRNQPKIKVPTNA